MVLFKEIFFTQLVLLCIVDEAKKRISYKLKDCNLQIEDNVILFVEE